MKLLVKSFGCTMNHGEARNAVSLLRELGHDARHSSESMEGLDPDGTVIFTCDVIEATERRMWKLMEEVSETGKDLFVAGCLASIDGDRILERFPDAVLLDTMGVDRTADSIRSVFSKESSVSSKIEKDPPDRLDHIVPIASGCYGSCTYCITRRARGHHVSLPPERIVESIRKGLADGRKEILLTSQDTGAWGKDLGKDIDLGSLIRSVTSSIDDEMRIRVGMMKPDRFLRHVKSILDAYTDRRIFRFFHIPVQSGSDEVLRNMDRGYVKADIMELVKEIRKVYPQATISTDLITGFPGETLKDHELSVELLREMMPDILNITRFSPRKGTPASTMSEQVPGWVSKERSRELHRKHGDMVKRKLGERLGQHQGCLVTEVGKPGTMMARDENYTPVVIEGRRELLGRFVDLETDRVGTTYLSGRIVDPTP